MSVTHSAVSQHIKQLEARSASRSLSATAAECASRKKDGSMPCKSARRYSTSPTPRAWCRSNPAPRSDHGDAPSFGCHWLLPRLARFQARHPQIAVRLLTSPAVVNLQQEGIDLAIRMGQGDWEGMESRRLFADEQLVVAAPAIAAVTCRPPRRRSPPAILFFHGVRNARCSRRGWKSRSSPRACA